MLCRVGRLLCCGCCSRTHEATIDVALAPVVTRPVETNCPPTWAELDKLLTGHKPVIDQRTVNEPNNSVTINAPEACGSGKHPSFVVLATSPGVSDALPGLVSRNIGSAQSLPITSPMYVSVDRIRSDQAPNLDLVLKHLRSSEKSSGQILFREVSPLPRDFDPSQTQIISAFVYDCNSGRDSVHTTI